MMIKSRYVGLSVLLAAVAGVTSAARWSPRWGLGAARGSNGSIVLVGGQALPDTKNDVWISDPTGGSWSLVLSSAPWSARALIEFVMLSTDKAVLIGGGVRSWSTSDYGRTWQQAPTDSQFVDRGSSAAVVLSDDVIILMGGLIGADPQNDVWQSADGGDSWSLVGSASWSARSGHRAVAFPNDRILLLGGVTTGTSCLWSSEDRGVTWTELSSETWMARISFSMWLLPGGELIAAAGTTSSGDRSDSYVSTDGGSSWSPISESGPFGARNAPAAVATPAGALIIGGVSWPNFYNDVWRYTPDSNGSPSWVSVCEAGYAGTTSCQLCSVGLRSAPGQSSCASDCPPGSLPDGISGCSMCPTGSIVYNGTCVPCPAGSAPEQEQSTCMPCPPGKWAGSGSSLCHKCPSNTFLPMIGASSESDCMPCPEGKTSEAGSSTCSLPIPSLSVSLLDGVPTLSGGGVLPVFFTVDGSTPDPLSWMQPNSATHLLTYQARVPSVGGLVKAVSAQVDDPYSLTPSSSPPEVSTTVELPLPTTVEGQTLAMYSPLSDWHDKATCIVRLDSASILAGNSASNSVHLLSSNPGAPQVTLTPDAVLGANSSFGHSCAVRDSLLAVGAPTAAGGGAIQFFIVNPSSGGATPVGVVRYTDLFPQGSPSAEFGASVAIMPDGNVLVGAPEIDTVYVISGAPWGNASVAMSVSPQTHSDIVVMQGDRFGESLSVGTDANDPAVLAIAIGAPMHGETGAVVVFKHDGNQTAHYSTMVGDETGVVIPSQRIGASVLVVGVPLFTNVTGVPVVIGFSANTLLISSIHPLSSYNVAIDTQQLGHVDIFGQALALIDVAGGLLSFLSSNAVADQWSIFHVAVSIIQPPLDCEALIGGTITEGRQALKLAFGVRGPPSSICAAFDSSIFAVGSMAVVCPIAKTEMVRMASMHSRFCIAGSLTPKCASFEIGLVEAQEQYARCSSQPNCVSNTLEPALESAFEDCAGYWTAVNQLPFTPCIQSVNMAITACQQERGPQWSWTCTSANLPPTTRARCPQGRIFNGLSCVPVCLLSD